MLTALNNVPTETKTQKSAATKDNKTDTQPKKKTKNGHLIKLRDQIYEKWSSLAWELQISLTIYPCCENRKLFENQVQSRLSGLTHKGTRITAGYITFLFFPANGCLTNDFSGNDWGAGQWMDAVSTGIIGIRKKEEAGTLLVSHVTEPHYTRTSPSRSPSQVFITLGFREKSI